MNKLTLNIHKKKAQIMSKMGRLEISQDQEFDSLLSTHLTHKKNIQETIRCFKTVSDNFHTLSTNLAVLVHAIQNTYQASDPAHPYLERVARNLEQFDENYVQQFQKEIQFSCVDSIMNFLVELDTPRQAIHLREKSKIEYDEKRTQLNKLLESKKPTAQQKIPQAKEKLQVAESNYQSSRFQAKSEMAHLLNDHPKYMDPSLIAFQRSLSALAKGMESTLGQLESLALDMESTPLEREKIEVEQQPLENGDENGFEEQDQFLGGSESNHNSLSSFVPPSNTINSQNFAKMPEETEIDDFFNEASDHPQKEAQLRSKIPEEFDTDWYYLNEDLEQQGPFGIQELARLYKSKEIHGNTHVFGGDLSDWLELDQVPRLRLLLDE